MQTEWIVFLNLLKNFNIFAVMALYRQASKKKTVPVNASFVSV